MSFHCHEAEFQTCRAEITCIEAEIAFIESEITSSFWLLRTADYSASWKLNKYIFVRRKFSNKECVIYVRENDDSDV